MILATTKVEEFDRFMEIFSTKGADKRRQHGSKGAQVFRDPNEGDRVWVLFDWDEEGWQSFVSDPEVPPIMQQAGHKGGRRPRRPAAAATPSRLCVETKEALKGASFVFTCWNRRRAAGRCRDPFREALCSVGRGSDRRRAPSSRSDASRPGRRRCRRGSTR